MPGEPFSEDEKYEMMNNLSRYYYSRGIRLTALAYIICSFFLPPVVFHSVCFYFLSFFFSIFLFLVEWTEIVLYIILVIIINLLTAVHAYM